MRTKTSASLIGGFSSRLKMKAGIRLGTSLLFTIQLFILCGSSYGDSIYVSSGSDIVGQFDESGNLVRHWNGSPLNGPTYLAFDSAGNLYVAGKFETVQRLDTVGNWSFFAQGAIVGTPQGLAFDPSGNLYAVDRFGRTVSKTDPTGHVSTFKSWGGSDTSPNNQGLAFDASGNMYVASAGDGAILKFSTSGGLSDFAYGSFRGLAFDSTGNLFAAEYTAAGGGHIMKFDPSGNGSLFASGFSFPNGLAFDSSANLFVVDSGVGDIIKFDAGGNRSVFAHLDGAFGVAIQTIPEPSGFALINLGIATLLLLSKCGRCPREPGPMKPREGTRQRFMACWR